MKIYLLIISLFLLTSINTFAFVVPNPDGFITDRTHKLTSEQVSQLNEKTKAIRASSKNEIAVLVIPSVEDSNIDDLTHEVFNTWRIGKAGLDNGVLLVIATESRKIRIQTGKGVEGDLPDIVCNDILQKMKDPLRKGDLFGGINLAIDQINSKLESRKGQVGENDAGVVFGTSVNKSANNSCSVSVLGHSESSDLGWIVIALIITVIVTSYMHKTGA